MPTFLDVPQQAIPYFEPVKGNNGKDFKERNIERPVADRSSHVLQLSFGLKKTCLKTENTVFLHLLSSLYSLLQFKVNGLTSELNKMTPAKKY